VVYHYRYFYEDKYLDAQRHQVSKRGSLRCDATRYYNS